MDTHRRTPPSRARQVALAAALSIGVLAAGSVETARADQDPARELTALSDALESLAARVTPSVVQIFTSAVVSSGGVVQSTGELLETRQGSGSGVMIDDAGHIVTNAHVVSGASVIQVEVQRAPGASERSILGPLPERVRAELVGVDLESDLAVLRVESAGIPALEVADSDGLRVGQLVLAFGSPLGLANSVSMGVVSAVARQLGPEDPMIYVQTDAPINPGSSGGPLVDTDGRLVGVNTLIVSQSGGNEGIGFAVPSNIVLAVADQIRRHGRVRRGEIGISVQTITPVMAAGLDLARSSGVVVGDVLPLGPADLAGLEVGDVIATLDGKPMENARQLLVNLYPKPVGDRVTLEVVRAGRSLSLQVTVGERPADPRQFESLVDPTDNLVPRLGILALTLTAAVAERLPPLRLATGVVVAASAATVPGGRAGGFQPGDVIYAVNGGRVRTLEDLQGRMAALAPGAAAVVQLERRGLLQYLALTVD